MGYVKKNRKKCLKCLISFVSYMLVNPHIAFCYFYFFSSLITVTEELIVESERVVKTFFFSQSSEKKSKFLKQFLKEK